MAKRAFNFPVFRHAPAVTFGRGSARSLAEICDSETAFFVSASASVRGYLEEALAREGGSLHSDNIFQKPVGEPTVQAICDGAAFLGRGAYQRIVAVGGGSVMDWARLCWAERHGIVDLESARFDETQAARQGAEFWLVPTTCGTGAEAGGVVVYSNEDGEKRSLTSYTLTARQVVLDGRFLDSLPGPALASYVCDALSHALEAYVSVVPNALAKESAVSALHLILSNFSADPGPSQKDRLMEASFLGGVAAANCSVGIVHAFAHCIGAEGVPHGVANACALRAGLSFNAATPQMRDLLERLGCDDAGNLIERISPITDLALESTDRYPAIGRLRESEFREQLAGEMARDVAIRSNPRRPTPEERLEFVTSVNAGLLNR